MIQVVNKYWDAISWDFQHELHHSAEEYFQFVPSPKRPGWRRKRSWREFMGFFDRLMNIDGTAIQEAVLTDPEVAQAMARAPRSRQKGSKKPRLFGFTREVSLMTSMLEVQLRTRLPRPEIPAERIRLQESASRLKSKLSKQFNLS